MKKKQRWLLSIGSVIVVAGIVTAIVVVGAQTPVEPELTAPTASATVGSLSATVTGKGAVAAARTAAAAFVDGGRVTGIAVAVGQSVVEGQDLATIDPAPAELVLDKARGGLTAAQSALDSARSQDAAGSAAVVKAKAALAALASDSPDKAGAEALVREQEAQVPGRVDAIVQAVKVRDDAEREVTAAQTTVDATVLKAPMAGVVTAVNGTVGAIVGGGGSQSQTAGETASAATASTGLVLIADVSTYRVTASIPEASIGSVALDQTATITLAAKGAAAISGTVIAIAPTPLASTDGVVNYPVTLQLIDPPAGTLLGQTGVVDITVATADDAVIVPAEAVTLTTAQEGTVSVLSTTGQAQEVRVTVGITNTTSVQIVDGLKDGDVVQLLAQADSDTGGSEMTGDFPPGFDGGQE